MRVARVAAQAKVNLTLLVGAAAPDGYHGILTVFQRIDLADDIAIRVGGSVRALDCDGSQVPAGGLGPPEKNLAYRAAVAYAARASWVRGFSIELTKNVPVGAGLGGGSADAGAVLRALDALAPTALGGDVLREIAAELGADVAFFATDAVTARGSGRGEQLALLEPLPAAPLLLAVPAFAIATADAYRWLDEAGGGTLAPGSDPGPHHMVGAGGWESIAAMSRNDFEPAMEARFPHLAVLRRQLQDGGAIIARLAGSGSTVFGVFPSGIPILDVPDAQLIPTRTAARVVQVQLLK